MNHGEILSPPPYSGRAGFDTTNWSVILMVGQNDLPNAEAALARLCETYWHPLYAYVRRSGHSEHDAKDQVQGFFEQLIERESLRRVAPNKGRFRSFLLAA